MCSVVLEGWTMECGDGAWNGRATSAALGTLGGRKMIQHNGEMKRVEIR